MCEPRYEPDRYVHLCLVSASYLLCHSYLLRICFVSLGLITHPLRVSLVTNSHASCAPRYEPDTNLFPVRTYYEPDTNTRACVNLVTNLIDTCIFASYLLRAVCICFVSLGLITYPLRVSLVSTL